MKNMYINLVRGYDDQKKEVKEIILRTGEDYVLLGQLVGVTVAKAVYKAVPCPQTESDLHSARLYAKSGIDDGGNGGDYIHDSIVAIYDIAPDGIVYLDTLKRIWGAVRSAHQMRVNCDLKHVVLEDLEGNEAVLGFYTVEDKIVTALSREIGVVEDIDDGLTVSHIIDAIGQQLSNREMQCLRLLAEGYGVTTISQKMRVSTGTIKNYRARIQKAIFEAKLVDYVKNPEVTKSSRALPTPITATSEDGELIYFETVKAASEFIGVARTSLLRQIDSGKWYHGYKFRKV